MYSVSPIFEDGGQTVHFRAKDYKDMFFTPYFQLFKKSIQVLIGLVEAEKSWISIYYLCCCYQRQTIFKMAAKRLALERKTIEIFFEEPALMYTTSQSK